MSNEEMINELKKDLVYNQYRDTYVIRGENLPFMAERLVKLFAIPNVVGRSEQLKNAEQEGYKKGWEEGAQYGYSAACEGR